LGATPEALGYAGRVLALVPDYDRVIFSTYSRFEVNDTDILQYGIPNDRRAAQAYFRYALSGAGSQTASSAILRDKMWTWLGEHHFRDREIADEYAAFLTQHGLREQASKIAPEFQ
jgi:hypothetical protein